MTKPFGTDHSRPKTPARLGQCALVAAMTLVLAACTIYPLGMSKEEWTLLTPEQQLEARMKQADLNRANAARRAEQAAARRQKYAAMEAAERRRIEELYEAARYGDVLECVVEGGTAGIGRGWRSYTPAPFTLARGEIKAVTLSAGGRNGKFWAQYSPDGLSMKLCYDNPRDRGGRYCASVNGQSAEFSAGISRRVSVNRVFRDASVVCAYRPELNMPQVYIRRHNPQVYRVIHTYHYRNRPRHTPVVINEVYSRPAPRERTRTVIHEHYSRPEQRERTKTVIHEHYNRPEPRERTKTVIHEHYNRPEPRERTKTVVHERYNRPAEPRERTKTVVHEHYQANPQQQTASNPDPVEPRRRKDRGRRWAEKGPDARKQLQETPDYEAWVDDYLDFVRADNDKRGRGKGNR